MSCERQTAGFRRQASGHDERRRRAGFSLVEVMVVIVIIGLLAGAVTIGVRSYLDKAKQNRARQDLATISHALESFYAEYSRYPNNNEGLEALTQPSDKWPEPLLTAPPKDPWGNAYQYNSPGPGGQPYEVVTYGADGREGGEGINADISSVDLKK